MYICVSFCFSGVISIVFVLVPVVVIVQFGVWLFTVCRGIMSESEIVFIWTWLYGESVVNSFGLLS